MGAGAVPVSGHFIEQAKVHVRLDQIRIELNGSFEVITRDAEIAPLNGDEAKTIGCGRVIRIVRKNPFEHSLGIINATLLKVRRGQVGLAFEIGWVESSGFLILNDRFVFLPLAKTKICNPGMQPSVLDSPLKRRLVQL